MCQKYFIDIISLSAEFGKQEHSDSPLPCFDYSTFNCMVIKDTWKKEHHNTIMMLKTYFINIIEYSINIQIFQVIT